MAHSEVQVHQAVKKILTDYLHAKKLRKTPERYRILDAVYAQPAHFDSEKLYQDVCKRYGRVSRMTVYNTLELLVACKLVTKHSFGERGAEYEKAYEYRQHDHIICTDCKKIFEFCDPRMYRIQQSVEDLFHFKVIHHALLFYGRCTKTNCKWAPKVSPNKV